MFEEFAGYDISKKERVKVIATKEAVVKRKLRQAIVHHMKAPTSEMPYASSNDFYQRSTSLEYKAPEKRAPRTRFASSSKQSRAKTPNSADDSQSASGDGANDDEHSDESNGAPKWLTVEGLKDLIRKY